MTENGEKIPAVRQMEERAKKRERKKRQRMPMHGADLKKPELQKIREERHAKKIIKILRRK